MKLYLDRADLVEASAHKNTGAVDFYDFLENVQTAIVSVGSAHFDGGFGTHNAIYPPKYLAVEVVEVS